MNSLKELYAYRVMIFSLVRKDLRTRYKASVLGFLWTFINPLLQLLVYSVVFSFIMRVKMDKYYVYMFIGLLPWIFFCTSIQGGATSVMAGADLIKKIYFPRLVLPIATVSAAFMNMVFGMTVLFAALFISGLGVSRYIVYLPVLMVLLYLFSLGLAFIFSALNVYFRDIEHILGIVIMSLFYSVPIIYPMDMVPSNYINLYKMNPLVPLIHSFQEVLYYQRVPQMETLRSVVIWATVFLVVGFFVFQKLQRNFVEEL